MALHHLCLSLFLLFTVIVSASGKQGDSLLSEQTAKVLTHFPELEHSVDLDVGKLKVLNIEIYYEESEQVLSLELKRVLDIYHPEATILSHKEKSFSHLKFPSESETVTFSTIHTKTDVHASVTVSRSGSVVRGTVVGPNIAHEFVGEENFREGSRKLSQRTFSTVRFLSKADATSLKRSLRQDIEIQPFEDCFPGDNVPHFLDIGIAADLSFFEDRNSDEDSALALIESFVSTTNLVFKAQLNIFLRLKQVIIVSNAEDVPEDLAFFAQSKRGSVPCSSDPDELLANFKSWVARIPANNPSDKPQRQALWQLLTACFDGGIIGQAFVEFNEIRGTLCEHDAGVNSGFTSITSRGFVSFAHEVAHNFGAGHSFENGVGLTGGIMDNGDGVFQGIVQFRTQRKEEICFGLTRASGKCGALFTEVEGECAGSDLCEGGVCVNGVCEALQYFFQLNDDVDISFRPASELVATRLRIPESFAGDYEVLASEEPGNRHGCFPLETTPSNGQFYILVEDLRSVTNNPTLENCTYRTIAQNIKDSGFKGAVLYDPFTNDFNSIFPIVLTEEEIAANVDPVEELYFVSTTNTLGIFLSSKPDNIEVMGGGWLSSGGRPFSLVASVEVPPEEEAPTEFLFITIIGGSVGLVVVGLVAVFCFTSDRPVPRRVRESFASHLPRRSSKARDSMEDALNLLDLEHKPRTSSVTSVPKEKNKVDKSLMGLIEDNKEVKKLADESNMTLASKDF